MIPKDLAGLRHRLPSSGGKPPVLPGPAGEGGPLDLAGLLAETHASIRAAEKAEAEASARAMKSYLEAWVAERLAVQEAVWEERLESRQRELAEENERLLAAYAVQIRREALPELSAIQMGLALCNEEKRRTALEEELARTTAAIEQKISLKKAELEEERGRSLDELRREAREAMDRLAADLRAEAQGVLADYLARGGKAFSSWLAEDLRAEAALVRTWGIENEDEKNSGGEAGG